MNIITPLSRIEELEPLLAAGADELYCSVVPRDWKAKFKSSAVSRRLFSSLADESDLELAIAGSAARGKAISLVLNAQHYTSEQIDCLLQLARRFAAMGGHAVIVADPMLLSLIAAELPALAIHLSSVASCRNAESSAFFRQLGVTRVIFPRDMTLAEMARISKASHNLTFEAFVLNDGCVFEEGVCHSIHLPAQLGGAICMDKYGYRYARTDGQRLDSFEEVALATNDEQYQRWLWHRFSNGFSVTPEGYSFGPCGLCALPRLRQAGISAIKIAGRDAPLARKLKSVELVRRVRDRMDEVNPEIDLMSFAQGARGESYRCQDGRFCYYPEVMRRYGGSRPEIIAIGR